jgi:hypothetical protein
VIGGFLKIGNMDSNRFKVKVARRLLLLSRLYVESTLTNTLTEVVELGATHFAAAGDFNLSNTWCVKWEYALNAFARRDLANGVGCVDAASFFADAKTGEDLDTLFSALNNTCVDFQAVTDVEICDVFDLLLFDFIDDIHGCVELEED